MPFLRFSRDKRGYEHIYLVHAANRRGKPSRPRVLYWYRSPPGIKVGRAPFDDEVRRTLEAQNPGVTFDWEAIVSTPIPPPDLEHWRERRRIEREAKQARRSEEAVSATESMVPVIDEDHDPDALAALHPVLEEILHERPVEAFIDPAEEPSPVEPAASADVSTPFAEPLALPESSQPNARRRRRRRGGRKRGSPAGQSSPPDSLDSPPNPERDSSKLPESEGD